MRIPTTQTKLGLSDAGGVAQASAKALKGCAEIPDKVSCPDLYNIVVTNNIHGQCGSVNRSALCMIGR